MNHFVQLILAFGASLGTLWAQMPAAPAEETVQLKRPDVTLEGTLTLPAQKPKKGLPVILLIAGSGPTDRNGNNPIPAGQPNSVKANSYKWLADSLAAKGVAVLRYDKRFSGKSLPADRSKVREEELRFETYITDAVEWVRQLQQDSRFARVYVAGHSEGSLIGMVVARQTKATGYISLAGVGQNSAEVLKAQLATLPEPLREQAHQDLDSLKNGMLVKKPPLLLYTLLRPSVQPYLISWFKYDPAVEIKQVPGPVLIVQGKRDIQVAAPEAEILKTARPDARLVWFDQMNHLLKNSPEDRAGNLGTYTQPDLPLTPGLASVIAEFVKK